MKKTKRTPVTVAVCVAAIVAAAGVIWAVNADSARNKKTNGGETTTVTAGVNTTDSGGTAAVTTAIATDSSGSAVTVPPDTGSAESSASETGPERIFAAFIPEYGLNAYIEGSNITFTAANGFEEGYTFGLEWTVTCNEGITEISLKTLVSTSKRIGAMLFNSSAGSLVGGLVFHNGDIEPEEEIFQLRITGSGVVSLKDEDGFSIDITI